ncbi:LysR family transcriptional regulator [Paenibacillus sacheonensis]|uniref:LysR family transcriptional regulator n=1 Tax=Paenibacillus sacheonensis TaxID=742054 RepID=A0A7X4YQP6_9BACL|nr:LysR family transcriptional regulator [Paenibacillus sacheonensis]MBM7567862.1 DNA-binding transcriptional LysR family regulator [Paenibacillus sacheonensis]NBC70748.1 LysR family transcriptional regulator [Paenibacillus sacheonensis]
MDLRALKTFEACVRLGHFQKAAEELQYAPSTVTLQIQRLEADLGVSLFVRDGKRVIVSEAGRWLHQEAAALLKSIGSIRQTVSDIAAGDDGTVRFAAIEPLASQRLAPVIAGFCKSRPKVELTMEVSGSKSILDRVRAGELDFGICSAPHASLMLEFEPLVEERLGVMLPANHPLAERDSIEASDLAGLTVLVKEPTCIYRELWETTFCPAGRSRFSSIEVGSFFVIQQMVNASAGVGIVPIYGGLELAGSTVIRPFADLNPVLGIGIVYRDKNLLGKAALLLMNAVREVCASEPSAS